MEVTAIAESGTKTSLAERRIQVDLSDTTWLEIDFDGHRDEPIVVSIGARARRMRSDPIPKLLIQPHAGGVASVLVGDDAGSLAAVTDWKTRVFQVSKGGHKVPLLADEFLVSSTASDGVRVKIQSWSATGPMVHVSTLRTAHPAPGVNFSSLRMMVLIHACNLVSFRFSMTKGFILTPEVFTRLVHRAEVRRKWLRRLSFGLLGRHSPQLPQGTESPEAREGKADGDAI